MEVLVIGSGMMGTSVVKDLSEADGVTRITAADRDLSIAQRVKEQWSPAKAVIEPVQMDLRNASQVVNLMKEHDMVVGTYPERWALRVTEYVLEAGVDLVDVTALQGWEQRAQMHEQLVSAGITVIPGCGVAPGLANILMGIGTERVNHAQTGKIMVGGLPQSPRPPLDYAVVFSFETVIDEYTVSPRIIKDGRIHEMKPLSGLENVTFESPVGEAECFLTDGLNTLLGTMPKRGLQNVEEKTVRYKGHRDTMAMLLDCGFFGEEPIEVEGVDGAKVTPRQVTSSILTPLLQVGDTRDVTCMRIVVYGDERIQFDMMDYYDDDSEISSMARTTGYTCSIVAQMLAAGHIDKKGFLPPEEAITDKNYGELDEQLKRRGINVIESWPGD